MEPVGNKEPHFKSEPNIDNNPKKMSSLTKNILNSKSPINKLKAKNNSSLSRNDFEFIFIIGKGGFGKVWRVKEKKTNELYALKEMSKTKIIDKKSEKSINGEREFLSFLHHPFIVNMHYAFQDNNNLYLVMDLLTGGDLRYHCSRYRYFSEEQTRFFLACIIHSLNYIHKNNVIHRDIKPENLVLDDKGYVCITDFGVAKTNMKDNSSETSGTPGYMCPEVMYGKNHSFPADFFSIGVIGYEFMMGKRPYRGRGRKEIKEQMKNYQAEIKKDEMKDGWSIEGVEFINSLLQRNEKKRLGYSQGIKELKEHPWLKYYPWKDLAKKNLPAPFIPENTDNFDKKYCESIDDISNETQMRYEEIALCTHFNTVFEDFYFNKNEVKRKDLNLENYNDNDFKSDNDDNNESKENTDDNEKEEGNEDKLKENEDINNSLKKIDNEGDGNKKYSELIIGSKEQILAKDNVDIKEINNENLSNKDINSNLLEKDLEPNERAIKQLNHLIIKKRNNNIRKKNFFLPKNSSYVCLFQNSNTNNLNNFNRLSVNEGKKTKNDFINIKKINVNNKNTISKITNKTNSIELKDKYDLLMKKQNRISKIKNITKMNSNIKNVYNINKNEFNNINNHSNINIYLSINMFNKMINNHFNKNKFTNEKNTFQDLLNKQKQLIINGNKKKYLDNYLSNEQKRNYYLKNPNKLKIKKINRSNSVGLLLNNNNINIWKDKNNNKSNLNNLILNNYK